MRLVGALIGACIGGLLGAGAWAALAYYANLEVGWIAWGIGVLAGVGAMMGSKGQGDAATGGIAATAAIAGIALGKFGAIHFEVEKFAKLPATQAMLVVTEEDMVLKYAMTVVEEWTAANKKMTWPKDMDAERASTEADYPKAVWAEAKKRWTSLTADDRERSRSNQEAYRRQMFDYTMATAKSSAFKDSLGPFDILWVVLALGSAFAIGRGGEGGGDD